MRGAYLHGEQAADPKRSLLVPSRLPVPGAPLVGFNKRGEPIYGVWGGAGKDPNSPSTNPAANAAARAALFEQGWFSSITLPTQTWADGGSYAFDMPHAGVGLFASVRVSGTLTWTDTNASPVAPVLSSLAPFNLFNSVVFKDYIGNTRISSSGVVLHAIEAFKSFDDTAGETPNTTGKRGYSNTAIDKFSPGGTSGTGVAVDFAFVVPFSLHENTTIGTLPFTVPSGNNTLFLTLNPLYSALAAGTLNAESPLQTAATGHNTTTTANLTGATIEVTYYYIDPLPGAELPLMDFSQVYEIVDVKTTDNLSASATKQIILPTGRTYQALYGFLVNAGALTDTGISTVKYLINEATPTLNETYNAYLHRVRRTYGRDGLAGMVMWDWRSRPISPSNYGSIAIQLLLASTFTASGEVFFNLGKESLYVLQTQVY